MKTCTYQGTGVTPAALQMVSETEMESLATALMQDRVPAELRAKLDRLRRDDPRDGYLRQQSLLLLSLLRAVAAREFGPLDSREGERLLRMLAYVRKDNDAIPDTLPGGMADDHDLMRLTCGEFRELLQRFKSWHLARCVPLLWVEQRTQLFVGQAQAAC